MYEWKTDSEGSSKTVGGDRLYSRWMRAAVFNECNGLRFRPKNKMPLTTDRR